MEYDFCVSTLGLALYASKVNKMEMTRKAEAANSDPKLLSKRKFGICSSNDKNRKTNRFYRSGRDPRYAIRTLCKRRVCTAS